MCTYVVDRQVRTSGAHHRRDHLWMRKDAGYRPDTAHAKLEIDQQLGGHEVITARNLRKVYGTKVAVDNLSFDVSQGAVTGFLGPNGAGKSTTMRLMLGLDSGEGETLFNGQRFVDLKHPMRYVGAVLDGKAFHPNRTARDHLRMLGAANGIPRGRADQVLEEVGLSSVADRRPKGFSLGMGQRLGLAAAILGKPEYLILDEPGNGLDPQGIHWLRDFLRDYAAGGRTVFVSSHLLSEMSMMADRLVVIGQGRTLHYGDVKSFVDKFALTEIVVRSPRLPELVGLLRTRGATDRPSGDGAAIIGNIDPGLIGELAFAQGIPVHELTVQTPSLEEAFLRATTEAVEYGRVPQPQSQPAGAGHANAHSSPVAESPGTNYDPATSPNALSVSGAGAPAGMEQSMPVSSPLTQSHSLPTQAVSVASAQQAVSPGQPLRPAQPAAAKPVVGKAVKAPSGTQLTNAQDRQSVGQAPADGPQPAQPMSRTRMTASGSFVIDEDPHDPRAPWNDRIDRSMLARQLDENAEPTKRVTVFDTVARETDLRDQQRDAELGVDDAASQERARGLAPASNGEGQAAPAEPLTNPLASDSNQVSTSKQPATTPEPLVSRRLTAAVGTSSSDSQPVSGLAVTAKVDRVAVSADARSTSGLSLPETTGADLAAPTFVVDDDHDAGESTSRRARRQAERSQNQPRYSRNAPRDMAPASTTGEGRSVALPDTEFARRSAARAQAPLSETVSTTQTGAGASLGAGNAVGAGSAANLSATAGLPAVPGLPAATGSSSQSPDRPWDPLTDPLPAGMADDEETHVFASLQNSLGPRDMPIASHPVIHGLGTSAQTSRAGLSGERSSRSDRHAVTLPAAPRDDEEASIPLVEALAASPEFFADTSRAGRRRAERRAARAEPVAGKSASSQAGPSEPLPTSIAASEATEKHSTRQRSRQQGQTARSASPTAPRAVPDSSAAHTNVSLKPALRRSGRRSSAPALDSLDVPATSRRDLAAPKPAKTDTSEIEIVTSYNSASARRGPTTPWQDDKVLPRPDDVSPNQHRRSSTA